MQEREYWKEGMDAKRFALCVKRKLWVILAAALAGAVFAGGIYLIYRQATMGEKQYRAEVMFSIGYDIEEEDETLKAFINEYNAYTWGDMMKSDRVILPVMEAVPEVSREVIEASITTDIVSDPEFLTVGFVTNDAELSNRIAVAYIGSMAAFGETMRGRGLIGIEAWKTTESCEVIVENKVLYAAELGAILGLIAGALFLCGWYVLDDSLLLESDFGKKYEVPVIGYRTRQPDSYFGPHLDNNLTRLAKERAFREVSLQELERPDADFELLREAPVILYIPWGTPCLCRIGHVLELLRVQEIQVLGVVIGEADGQFLRAYYGMGKDKAR